MKDACESLRLVHDPHFLLRARVQKLGFLHSMLRGLSARVVSSEKRLTSEQVLVSPRRLSQRNSDGVVIDINHKLSNTISQDDSTFSSQIALATKEDGAAMKTIAVVTLTFLPATFVTVRSTIPRSFRF